MGGVWTGTPPFGRPVPGWLGMFRGGVAGGPQLVAAWVDAQGGGRDGARPSRGADGGARTRRSASLPFVLAGTDLSGTLQGVDGAAGANHISAFGANGNVRLDADCIANTDKWPAKRKSSENGVVRFRWEHSDFKNVAYFFVYKLFDRIVGKNSN